MNRKALIGVGVVAGLAQVVAGVVMYLAGVYFAPWSMFVSLLLLLLCIVAGTKWYATQHLNGKITYFQALKVGIAISVATGLIYALYNLISISWFYPNFLDDWCGLAWPKRCFPALSRSLQCAREVIALGIAIPI